ncbi:MAG: MarR family transcriptional regulator [Defluviitaleaceae bacterium]|nr:MarR family transcriptional regulator [Defluviitaleaceae bacterium]
MEKNFHAENLLEKNFEQLYLMFRSNYFKRLLEKIGTNEGSLSATESYCVEIIYLLGKPKISEFAQYLNLSIPNANYKINSLVKKGYVVREQSKTDLREQFLCVTEKFLNYYGLNDKIISLLMQRIREKFSPQDVEKLDEMIRRVNEIMQTIAEDCE